MIFVPFFEAFVLFVSFERYLSSFCRFLMLRRTLPALAWHRQNVAQILYPFVELTDSELEDLKTAGVCVVAFVPCPKLNCHAVLNY